VRLDMSGIHGSATPWPGCWGPPLPGYVGYEEGPPAHRGRIRRRPYVRVAARLRWRRAHPRGCSTYLRCCRCSMTAPHRFPGDAPCDSANTGGGDDQQPGQRPSLERARQDQQGSAKANLIAALDEAVEQALSGPVLAQNSSIASMSLIRFRRLARRIYSASCAAAG